MALRKVVLEQDPMLRKRSREVVDINDRIRTLVEDMWETMYESNGIGLAAPQVGVLRRVVVIDATEWPEDEDEAGGEDDADGAEAKPAEPQPDPEIVKYVLINPEAIEVSDETAVAREGCLSVPGKYGMVERPVYVKVRALGIDGAPFEVEGEGLLAKALMHEMDHLEGILYTDIAESVEDLETECKDQE